MADVLTSRWFCGHNEGGVQPQFSCIMADEHTCDRGSPKQPPLGGINETRHQRSEISLCLSERYLVGLTTALWGTHPCTAQARRFTDVYPPLYL